MPDVLDYHAPPPRRKRRWRLAAIVLTLILIGIVALNSMRMQPRAATVVTYKAVAAPPTAKAPVNQPTVWHEHVIHFEQAKSGVLIVDAAININPQHPEVTPLNKRLAIDTGAACTSFYVSPEMLGNLAKIIPDAKSDVMEQSDGSTVQVCRFDPARLSLIDLTVDMPVYASAHTLEAYPEFDGVIGQDFLSRYNVNIDYDDGVITLSERAGPQ
jgi:hypothetical protein